jgi:hypothetical protein
MVSEQLSKRNKLPLYESAAYTIPTINKLVQHGVGRQASQPATRSKKEMKQE